MHRLFCSIALCWLAAPSLAAPPLASDAWIRATPPNAPTAAAYAHLAGAGTEDRLLGARTDAADRVEIHTHVAEGGVMTMTKLDSLAIPADGAVTLAPGGDHLMLIGLRRALTPGETVAFTLVFEKSGEVTATFEVRDARAAAPTPAPAHHH